MSEHDRKPLVPLPALIADIGGTNARFATVDSNGALSETVAFPVADHTDLGQALTGRVMPALFGRPQSAVLALAATIQGDRAELTNGPWTIEPRQLIDHFGLSEVVLLNDFEALAMALPNLPEDATLPIGAGRRVASEPKLVIGAGTGLGAAALVRSGTQWLPLPSEGGHVEFGPVTSGDAAIWEHIRRSDERISAEAILSGAGIERLYRALADGAGLAAEPLVSADIVTRGIAAHDTTAGDTLGLFTAYLGRYAGDLALIYLARGGVYVAGGIAPRMSEIFTKGPFREAFVDKPPFQALMTSIPTWLITHPAPALLGLTDFINRPSGYAIDLTGRHWQ